MIYTCDNCKFLFERVSDVEQCPDCGKYIIRPANETEVQEFYAWVEYTKKYEEKYK